MSAVASQITSLTIAYSTVDSDADQRKHQSSASLAFVRGIHWGPVNSPHKWPVTRKMFPFDDVIMRQTLHTYDDVMAWKCFPYYWLFVRGIAKACTTDALWFFFLAWQAGKKTNTTLIVVIYVLHLLVSPKWFNISRPRQHGCHLAEDIIRFSWMNIAVFLFKIHWNLFFFKN